jgi:glycosyltransferase involved in cell wall biosynthesis
MHIAIDARSIFWTGVGRYIRNILHTFARKDTSHTFTVLVPYHEIANVRKSLNLPKETFTLRPVEGSYYSWKEQTVFLKQLYEVEADLFHFMHFNVPLLFRKPYVVTIHDITRFIFPGQKSQALVQQVGYEVVFARAVARARAAICVSENTRQELYQLPVTLPESRTIRIGIEKQFFSPVDEHARQQVFSLLGANQPYLLYVGVWMSHKNLRRLLEAFCLVKKQHPRLKLVVTGKPVPGYVDVVHLAQRMGIQHDVIFPGFVSHALLPALYAGAQCFVFPGLYEGFGLPPLEAARRDVDTHRSRQNIWHRR